jgi:hypothetical protein
MPATYLSSAGIRKIADQNLVFVGHIPPTVLQRSYCEVQQGQERGTHAYGADRRHEPSLKSV